MYNPARVKSALFGRVGWKQPTQAEYAILTEPNTLTKSGTYFNSPSNHAAVTIQNIIDAQSDPDISAPDFNLMLEDLQNDAIMRTCSAVFNSPEVVETVQLFDRETDLVDTLIENTGKFVGVRVDIGNTPDYVVALSQIALYFNADVEFELKCFIDNSSQAIWTKTVSAVGDQVTIIPIDDLLLSYMSNKSVSTVFYIGYFQDDIGEAQAYDEPVLTYWRACMFTMQTFEGVTSGTKFAVPPTYTSLTYGINPQFTTYKDLTNRILTNAALFDEAVRLQVAVSVIELLLGSVRSNFTQRITKDQFGDLYRELNQEMLDANNPMGPGLKIRWQREIAKLQKAFLGQPKIESHSLPYAVYQDRARGGGYSY